MTDHIGPEPTLDPAIRYRARQRRNRVLVILGFIVIALLGGLWAGLSKDPIVANGFLVEDFPGRGFQEDFGFDDAPAVEFPMNIEPTTTVAP